MIDKDVITSLYVDKALPVKDICLQLGITDTTLSNYLKRYQIPGRKSKPYTPCPDIQLLKELCANPELSNKEIANRFGVSPSKLWQWISTENINRTFLRNNEGRKPSKEVLSDLYGRHTPQEIGDMFGVTNVTIMNWIDSYDIQRKTFTEIRNSDSYKTKYQQTCIERYGHDTPLKNPDIQARMFESYISSNGYKSQAETECRESLNEFLGSNLKPNRKILGGKELDGYCETNNFAIEFCGLYWHSEKAGKGKHDHQMKWKSCHEKGIKLFTIFSDEWENGAEKIKKYIYMNMGKARTRLYARQCDIRIVNPIEAKDFCKSNHLQGAPNRCSLGLGLYHNDSLVQIMTFAKHHRQFDVMVMNRMCGEFDVSVVGGASRLMKHASRLLQRDIITWSDNRWSTGNVYEKMGCVKVADLPVDYYWTNFTRKVSKQSRRKSATKQPLELTEKQFNESCGLSRVWDCGKIKWLYPYQNQIESSPRY